MSSFRRTIPDFSLANPLYVGAQVFAYQVDANGDSTGDLATLYGGPRGTLTLPNPQILDGDGKFERPVYIEGPVTLEVVGSTVGSHGTGVVLPVGVWRGFWAIGTSYITNDFIANGDPDYPTIYAAAEPFTAGATIADDIAAGHLVKILDAGLLDAARDEAVEALNQILLAKDAVDTQAATVATQSTDSQAAYDEFRSVYYGPYAAEPTTRPDGSAIQEGDTFLRTTAPIGLHYYIAGSWAVPASDTVTLNNKLDKTHEGAGGTSRHPAATTALAGFMSAADKTKLDGIADNANNFTYTHPTDDGNRHVPATLAADVNKFLKSSGSPGGLAAWATLSKSDVGLSQVDNTSDANKPLSTAAVTALNAKAPLANPNFTGGASISGATIATQAWVISIGYATNTYVAANYVPLWQGVTGVRLGSAVAFPAQVTFTCPAGCVITQIAANSNLVAGQYKPIQRQINGAWATVTG